MSPDNISISASLDASSQGTACLPARKLGVIGTLSPHRHSEARCCLFCLTTDVSSGGTQHGHSGSSLMQITAGAWGLEPCLQPRPSHCCQNGLQKHHSDHACILRQALSCLLGAHKIVSTFHGIKGASALQPPNTIYPLIIPNALPDSKLLFLSPLWASAHAVPLSVSHEFLRLSAAQYPQHRVQRSVSIE